MDDLQMLAEALHKPDPSREAVDEGRHRLQNAMRRPSRRRRTAWTAAGLGLAGAAAATAVVVTTSGSGGPTGTPNGPPSPMSARQVLLVAAESAARAPEGKGTYWHVEYVRNGPGAEGRSRESWESWTTRTGRTWTSSAKAGGRLLKGSSGLSLGGLPVTFKQVENLPAEPAALKKWIAKGWQGSDVRTSAGKLTAADRREFGLYSLVSLVTDVPAAPGVRAAAFRAIATYPGVRSLGEVDGGQGLEFGSEPQRLVVDPATGRVRNTNFYVPQSGGTVWIQPPATMTITASWTDTKPA
ncbi:hypothetical protein E1293_24805 [Actinomadura darangshiensis]|uniref:CU044_5270 family protein n=1 Tax=Actinomadura darangshiensis TaxID=705336 RepID=A0A4R5B2L0_9ACTN|nr:CU044_5270 family protein [Actinomadura darangshiensis]TDD78939.1 hypothetical protein E1293_24805 [Actinomadura darangshiensis]